MADDNNKLDDERGKKPKPDALAKAWAQNPGFKVHKPRGRGFIVGGQSPSAAAQGMFKPEELSSPVTPEREAARQLLTTRSARWWQRWSAILSVFDRGGRTFGSGTGSAHRAAAP
jgi:hypothetical protein